jgi:enediyne biosynthesis protein E4
MTPVRRVGLAVLAAVLLMAAAGYLLWPRFAEHEVDYKMPGNPGPKIAAAQAAAIERRERVIEQTVWRKEMEAQEHGRIFEDLWDALNAATNKWPTLQRLNFSELNLGYRPTKEALPHAIERWLPDKTSGTRYLISYNQWREQLENWKGAGWGIMQCEFRHNAFDPQTNEAPAKSKFYFSAHLTNAAPARATIEGNLSVEWNLRPTNQPPTIRRIDASGLTVMFRAGPPAFADIYSDVIMLPRTSSGVEPLIVQDLDADGNSEIILAGLNRVYRRKGSIYAPEQFSSMPSATAVSALVADFDNDGIQDFLYATFYGLFLIKGGPAGQFRAPERQVCEGLETWKGPRCMTCGDIDGDGDLDVFVGQYKGPYVDASVPTPFYDANDGYPSYLLINRGNGEFFDGASAAGLQKKQFRHVLAASLVDLDNNGSLDLLTSCDFAGIDLFLNDGAGHFRDATDQRVRQKHAFGMGQVFTDFNNDGKIDFLVTGMSSPTADRLEHLGLNRARPGLDVSKRREMNAGNRLLLGSENGAFEEGDLSKTIARSGWSWGVASTDFDNDGWPDVYIANGMESLRTVHDSEGEFWLHDIFVANSDYAPGPATYFEEKGKRTRGRGISYGGFDKNRLFLNQQANSFFEAAHLLGVAIEEDCRNVVVDDVDGDGQMDIVVISLKLKPEIRFTLHVFRNQLQNVGNWIEFSFDPGSGNATSIGAKILIDTGEYKTARQVVAGDSYRSQSPFNVHVGVGQRKSIQSATIVWSDGATNILKEPAINKRHKVERLGRSQR